MKKAFIFDLDGTLLNSLTSIAHSANLALKYCGLPERNEEEYKYFAGYGALELIKRACYASGDTEYINLKKAFNEYKKIFKTECNLGITPFENIEKMLQTIKEKGHKIAVLSNKPHERTIEVAESIFGKNYFDFILGYKNEETKKPNPVGALQIAEIFQTKSEDCIYVGDTDTDMQTGKNANMYTVGVTWGFRDKDELLKNGADIIVNCPLEILNLI